MSQNENVIAEMLSSVAYESVLLYFPEGSSCFYALCDEEIGAMRMAQAYEVLGTGYSKDFGKFYARFERNWFYL